MPEGPEVAVVADAVRKKCPITFEGAEMPDNWEAISHNQFILNDVRTKGKLILLNITTQCDNRDWVLLITLGMSGDLRWNSSGHKHCRFSFLTQRGDLSFIDVRCFGTLRIMTPEKAKEAEDKIGWDLLHAPMPSDKWNALKEKKSVKKKEIGPTLLDQKLLAGVGNIYKAEGLYAAKIHPKTLIENVPLYKWQALNFHLHSILVAAYELKGTSVVDFTADGVEGQAQQLLKVYMQRNCPAGHRIKTIKQKDRTTWYCDQCQSKEEICQIGTPNINI
jgi:formamidopyrimidine-DNA glycosylase